MGFWDLVGSAAKAVGDSVEQNKKYLAECEDKSDYELARIWTNESNFMKKSAALKVLKSRGYETNEEIRNLL